MRPASGRRGRTGESNVAKSAEYTSKDIQVLEGLEAVRKRPGMYIGTTGSSGLHHLVYEVVDNAIDEALADRSTKIDVDLYDDGSVAVSDDGAGIPVTPIPGNKDKRPALEVVMTVLHAGGKFGGGGYQVSGGLHGVGVSVVNALSSKLEVEVHRDGYVWHASFTRGRTVQKTTKGKPTKRTGTTVRFWPDAQMFEETLEFKADILAQRLKELAYLTRGVTITLTDHRKEPPAVQTWKASGGIADFVKALNTGRETLNKVVYIEANEEGREADIAIQWNTTYNDSLHSFANTINTHEGGMHEEGFKKALTNVVNRYAREKGHLKEKDENLQGEDIREGIVAIVSVKLREPQFEGQTKTKLGNTEIRSFVERVVNDRLRDWLEEHPTEANRVARKGVAAAQARQAAKKARDIARKGAFEGGGLPGKLADCSSRDPDATEIFIVEGDSAGGSAKAARNRENQAILPIRGKILNVEKARIDKTLENQEIRALINAIGTGIGDELDMSKRRYGKIVMLTDADVDGAHIRTLLLTFLFRHMRPLIEGGYVYAAKPPLYSIRFGASEVHYVFSDKERDELIAQKGKKPSTPPTRFKGLGEMFAEELWGTTMNPETRTLVRVSLEDAAVADQIFTVLMGEDVEGRREFIQENAQDAFVDA
ncbi:MAG: DNA topoisomerase (ATP-hydrolyzing) subunit B [Actinobacteria bacterium]|nr:MAG: DNA topoisomerase (ATP-hydrolyzing) subunit B [Actinomycetota bacterium]